ncbi:MAG: hypothetical protein WBM63_11145, partial [Sedimenticolaceae bacterium]
DCGAVCNVLDWYRDEYEFACRHIKLDRDTDGHIVIIDDQLLSERREQGLSSPFCQAGLSRTGGATRLSLRDQVQWI